MGINFKDFVTQVQKTKDPKSITKTCWHLEYAMFSKDPELYGWVYQNWFPSGNWEAPTAEYDFNWEKGFKTYSDDYITENLREFQGFTDVNEDPDPDFEFYDKIEVFPFPVYGEIEVGYIDHEGNEQYYKDWEKEAESVKAWVEQMKMQYV